MWGAIDLTSYYRAAEAGGGRHHHDTDNSWGSRSRSVFLSLPTSHGPHLHHQPLLFSIFSAQFLLLSSVSKIRLFIFFTSPSSHTCSFITQVFIFYVSVCLTLTFLLLLFTCIVCFEVLHFLHTTEKELDLHYDHVKYIHSATH